jgi:hypothetical protein
MTNELIDLKLLNVLEEILPNGFQIIIKNNKIVYFEKAETERLISIGLGDLSYNTCQYGPQDFISFYAIENVLSKKRNLDESLTIRTRNHSLIFNLQFENGISGIHNFFPLKLTNDENIVKFKELVKAYIVQYSNPFFEYWSDWRLFLPFIENATLTGLHDYFAGYAIEKKLIIWKLCHHPKFEQYKEERKGVYENHLSQNPNDKVLQKEYKELMNLLNKLDKIKPLYDWDDKYLIAKPLG